MIRRATKQDAPAIWALRTAAIRAQCQGFYSHRTLDIWTNGIPTEQFALWVESSFYVAIDGDRVLGSGAIDLGSGKIDGVFVLPSSMSKGIGRQLLAHLESMASAAGLNEVVLDATLNAAPFYRKCGYKGSTVAVYSSPTGVSLECVPMQKVLSHFAVDGQPSGQADLARETAQGCLP